MRTFVQFDAEGRIHSVVTADAPEGMRAMVDVERGMSVAEVEIPELNLPTTDAEVEKIRERMQGYRVSIPTSAKPTLIKAK